MATVNDATNRKPSAFALSCAVLTLIALAQFWIGAVALAQRWSASKEVRVVEREVPKLVTVRIPAVAPEVLPEMVPAAPEEDVSATAAAVLRELSAGPAPSTRDATFENLPPGYSPSPLRVPAIADPVAERLVTEARAARVANDMGSALTKLAEALLLAPNDPCVQYELGLVHETMGVFDHAADHFNRVLDLGVGRAGALYEMAAVKLRDGFRPPAAAPVGLLSLGTIKVFHDPENPEGEWVVLTIPLQKSPEADISSEDFYVTTRFFNQTDQGRIVERDESTSLKEQWPSAPIDWAGGEEVLRVDYRLPESDPTSEHLFGGVKYYGYLITLHYANGIVDLAAWPRSLATRVQAPASYQETESAVPEMLDMDLLLPGGAGPLLLPPN